MNFASHDIPLLVIFFNRPTIFTKLVDAIVRIQPKYLFLASDGPRQDLNLQDRANIEKCKNEIFGRITWDCNVEYLEARENRGCDIFVPNAIDWFFTKVESGIILEDDCVVSNEFCSFAGELLERYRHDRYVMNISAPNFQMHKWGAADYYFSKYPSNWGWASWRRAWEKYDPSLSDLDDFLKPGGAFISMNLSNSERRYWKRFFYGLRDGRYTYWDAKWLYSIWKNFGVSITPNVNLSTNIGYGVTATHTKYLDHGHNLKIGNLESPLKYLDEMHLEHKADDYLFKTRYMPTIIGRLLAIRNKLKIIISKKHLVNSVSSAKK